MRSFIEAATYLLGEAAIPFPYGTLTDESCDRACVLCTWETPVGQRRA